MATTARPTYTAAKLLILAQLLQGFSGGTGFDSCEACDRSVEPLPIGTTGSTGSTGSTGPTGAQFGLDLRPNTTCVAPDRPSPSSGITLQGMFAGLNFGQITQAIRAQFAAGEPYHWLVVEKAGDIKLVQDTDPSAAYPFLDLESMGSGDHVRSDCYECGLLGLALDPDFKSNRRIYVTYNSMDGCPSGNYECTFLSRFTVTPNATRTSFSVSEEEKLLRLDKAYDNHNGGGLGFGTDGMLYASFGDGGSYLDALGNAQNKDVCFGKILRLDVSGSSGYTVPADNPFAGQCAAGNQCCPLVYAYGLRNPWRISFDRATGAMWVGDVGQDTWEEVNRIEKGGNYGWPCYEGAHAFQSSGACATLNGSAVKMPIIEYANAEGARQSITGGYVYRGSQVDALKGKYYFGDFGSRELWAVDNPYSIVPTLSDPASLIVTPANISTFAEDENGEAYVINLYGSQGTEMYKIVPATSGGGSFPQRLSDTGCFNGATPIGGLIPYEINSPLWSDGANKRRFLAVPNNQYIHVESDGDFTFPIGTVLAKEFSIGSTRVETRLFVRHSDGGWAGYSYKWNAAGTDAELLSDRTETVVNGQAWTFPSRGDCLSCHTQGAGYSLGPEIAQLNRSARYPSTGRTAPQLETLAHIGLFDATLPGSRARYPSPSDTTQPVDARARSYLHANCSGCHRPNAGAPVPPNFLYGVSFAAMGVCNAAPQRGTLGLTNPHLLTPGSPASSVISARMHSTGSPRMPPLGTTMVDGAGTSLVDAWISSIGACP